MIRALFRRLMALHRRYMAKHDLLTATRGLSLALISQAAYIQSGGCDPAVLADYIDIKLLAWKDYRRAAKALRTFTNPAMADNEEMREA